MPRAVHLRVQPAATDAAGLAASLLSLTSATQIVSGDPDVKYLISLYRKPTQLAALWVWCHTSPPHDAKGRAKDEASSRGAEDSTATRTEQAVPPPIAESCHRPLPYAMADFEVQVAYASQAAGTMPSSQAVARGGDGMVPPPLGGGDEGGGHGSGSVPAVQSGGGGGGGGGSGGGGGGSDQERQDDIGMTITSVAAAAEDSAGRLAVRSSLSPHSLARSLPGSPAPPPWRWGRMPSLLRQPAERSRVIHEHGEWFYRDACVSYDPFSLKVQLAQAAPEEASTTTSTSTSTSLDVGREGASREGASLLWPLQSPPQFIEFVGNVWKEPKPYLLKNNIHGEQVRHYPLRWHRGRVGLVYSISLDNLWHALWHAVPMREYAERAAASVLNGSVRSSVRSNVRSSVRSSVGRLEGRLMRPRHGGGGSTAGSTTTTTSTNSTSTIVTTVASSHRSDGDRGGGRGGPSPASPSAGTSVPGAPPSARTGGDGFTASTLRFRRFDVLPDYTYLWPKLPKGARHNRTGRYYGPTAEGYRDYVATAGRVASWPGFELSGLSLMPPHEWAEAVGRTQSMLSVGTFHCFKRLYGGHGRFFPHFAKVRWRGAWVAYVLRPHTAHTLAPPPPNPPTAAAKRAPG